MPLVDLKTNLKSLRYGKDRPGGGSSPEPFIQVEPKNSFDIPTEEIGTSGGKDWVLRGGALTLTRSAQDASRLLKWGTDNSLNSVIFTAKQISLSAQGQTFGAGGPDGTSVQGEGVYLPTNTLAQVAVNAFGAHGNKQGLTPFDNNNSFITGLGKILQLGSGPSIGRPTYLFDYLSNPEHPAIEPEFNRLVYLANTSFDNTTGTLFKYNGGPGPGAPGGIGTTRIKFSSGNRTGDANPLRITSPTKFYGTYKPAYAPGKYLKLVGTPYNPGASGEYLRLTGARLINPFNEEGQYLLQNNVYTQGNTFPNMFKSTAFPQNAATFEQNQLIEKTPISKGGQISDFRKQITVNKAIAQVNGMLTAGPDYQTNSIDGSRINYFDPGSKVRDRSNYRKGSGIVDAINGLYLYYQESVDRSGTNDLVKFRFAVIDPDSPSNKTFVHFRSYFDGAITDNMSANWESYRYQGRGEEFFHYGGFSREIGFGFKVPAQSKEELSVMYKKLNYLQSTMAPNYSDAGYMRGNIVQVTIGGYLYEVPGIITNLNYTLPEDSPWEIGIGIDGGEDFSVKELSQMVNVSITFKPIHNFLPETIKPNLITSGGNITQRFISLANVNGNLYANGISPNQDPTPKQEQDSEPTQITEGEQYSGGYRNFIYDVPTSGQVAAENQINQIFPFEAGDFQGSRFFNTNNNG